MNKIIQASMVAVLLGSNQALAEGNSVMDFCRSLLNRTAASAPIERIGPPTWTELFKAEWERQKPEFSKKQIALWSEALEHLTEDLEAVGQNEARRSKSRALKEQLELALKKLPEIYTSYQGIKEEDRRAKYFKASYEAVWAAVTVHSHEIMDGKSDLDYARYFKIIRTINEFDSANPKFSFYKIRRAIEGRFNMNDFANCK